MSIANVTEDAILNLIFSATTWANYANNATTTPETNIVAVLHTADPGETGNGSTSEITYAGYARTNVARSTGWTTSSAGSVSPAAIISFPIGTAGGTPIATFFSVGKSGGGTSPILFSGTVTPNITTGNGVTPQLSTSTTITLD
jgi:hypothetical protein